jgi:penicillin amidase
MRRRLLISVSILFGIAIVALAAALLWGRSALQSSLAVLDGQRALAGLSATVTIERDALGIPAIRGATREDIARATGFLHAQERFFQMDLARRRAAGELAALVGGRALAVDRETRIHRFRAQARRAVSLLSPRDRRVLDAYVAGANAGLGTLEGPPFEYRVLRQTPQPWRAEDSLLVVLSMFIVLQDTDGSYEAALSTLHDVLPAAVADFVAPRGTEWDSPVIGGAMPMPPVPDAAAYDLRQRRTGKPRVPARPRPEAAALWDDRAARDAAALGSNNWVVSGALTESGHPLVANDMHLTVRVPNTWYRAMAEWEDGGEQRRAVGVMLAGVPAFVAGSNTRVAWGFTNTYADWSDLVLLEIDPANPDRYRTPDGWRAFERHEETIEIAGQPPQRDVVRWTIWGPVLGPDHRGRPRAYRWVAHSAERLAAALTPLEGAATVAEAFDSANSLGAPGQNVVLADSAGNIGWTVYGSIPRRTGLAGRLPQSWADGSHGWSGWLAPAEYPRILNPPGGRIWTANARVVDGEMLARLGDGSYEVGSRARTIRNQLAARDRFTARDMLAIQLDTSSGFLERWHDLLLRTLSPAATRANPGRAELRVAVEGTWTGQASPESAAYRFTRVFRELVSERVMMFLLSECVEVDAAFDYTVLRNREGPIWALLTERPLHLLDPYYPAWDALLLDAVDAMLEDVDRDGGGALADHHWSQFNVTTYRHPLSASLPFVGRLLDMPIAALPGDLFTVRMHWGSVASSERMIVSPGREADGMMHMPTGQSGHPLSPFYANSHPAWVRGEATPLLPGAARHTLRLVP